MAEGGDNDSVRDGGREKTASHACDATYYQSMVTHTDDAPSSTLHNAHNGQRSRVHSSPATINLIYPPSAACLRSRCLRTAQRAYYLL